LLGVVGAAAFQVMGARPVGRGILPVEDSRDGEVDRSGRVASGSPDESVREKVPAVAGWPG
jgi:hypothetical protein